MDLCRESLQVKDNDTVAVYLQHQVLKLLSTQFLSSLGAEHQRTLVHCLLHLASTQAYFLHADTTVLIKEIFRRLPLDPELPAQDITNFVSELQSLLDDSAPSSKKGRFSSPGSESKTVCYYSQSRFIS